DAHFRLQAAMERHRQSVRGLRELQRDGVAGQQAMDESLPHLLIGILVVSRRIVKGTKEFLAANFLWASIHQFVHESTHCVVVGNSKFVRMRSEEHTSEL